MNEVVKPKPLLDGFQGFEDAVEGADFPANRLIQGQLVKFTNQSTYVTGGGEELPDKVEFVAVNVTRVVQKWGEGQPIETIVLEPGQKFPRRREAQRQRAAKRVEGGAGRQAAWAVAGAVPRLSAQPEHRRAVHIRHRHHRRRHRRSRPGRSYPMDAQVSRRERLRRGHPVQHVHEHTVRRAPAAALRDQALGRARRRQRTAATEQPR